MASGYHYNTLVVRRDNSAGGGISCWNVSLTTGKVGPSLSPLETLEKGNVYKVPAMYLYVHECACCMHCSAERADVRLERVAVRRGWHEVVGRVDKVPVTLMQGVPNALGISNNPCMRLLYLHFPSPG